MSYGFDPFAALRAHANAQYQDAAWSQAQASAAAQAQDPYAAQQQAAYMAAHRQAQDQAARRAADPRPAKPAGDVLDLVQGADGVWHEPAALPAPR